MRKNIPNTTINAHAMRIIMKTLGTWQKELVGLADVRSCKNMSLVTLEAKIRGAKRALVPVLVDIQNITGDKEEKC